MSGRHGHGHGGGKNPKNVLLPPINYIFKLLQSGTVVSIWLYEQLDTRIEGKIKGFDEYMNMVIDNAVEVKLASGERDEERRQLGPILLKGDNVTLIMDKHGRTHI